MSGQWRQTGTVVADRQSGWVERLPERWRDFAVLARWDRPIGTWLLLLPCWWGTALASVLPDLKLFVLFAIGAVAMRGAGCTINDLADRDFDRRVERTRNRPLAAGRIRTDEALFFVALQMLVGALVLLFLPGAAIIVSLLSLPLVVSYPFMKRITWWPQAFLGLTFNWGALVGWAAVTGGLSLPAVLLYAAGFFWTLGYDTIYAHQDKEDDALVGVKSTARLLGERTPAWLWAFYGLMLALLLAASLAAGKGWPTWIGLAVAAVMLAKQILGLRMDDPADCLRHFRANRDVGLVVTLALAVGGLPL
ncbi:MAG: 4-hydroxybenzoate octaprenyltransferase [Geminicoccaceae bacterium]